MAEKIDLGIVIAAFAALAAILTVEVVLIFQRSPPIRPWLSHAARFASVLMFGHSP
jgi:hypothetical protein